MRSLKILLLLLSVTFLGCEKDKEPGTPEPVKDKSVPVIKGIQKRDINAQPVGVVGTPNTNTRQSEATNNMIAYANPAGSDVSIRINAGAAGEAKIRMVKGEYMESSSGPDEILAAAISIPLETEVDLTYGSNFVMLNLLDVPNGYYRLYVEFNSYTLWDNILVVQ